MIFAKEEYTDEEVSEAVGILREYGFLEGSELGEVAIGLADAWESWGSYVSPDFEKFLAKEIINTAHLFINDYKIVEREETHITKVKELEYNT